MARFDLNAKRRVSSLDFFLFARLHPSPPTRLPLFPFENVSWSHHSVQAVGVWSGGKGSPES